MHDYTTFKSCQHFKEWGESYLQIKLKTLESLHRSQSICIETENQWLVNITHISYIYIYIYVPPQVDKHEDGRNEMESHGQCQHL